MMYAVFACENYEFEGDQEVYGDPTRIYEKKERIVNRNELHPFYGYEDWEGINNLCTLDYGFDHENTLQKGARFPKDQEQFHQSIITQDSIVFHSDMHEIPDLVEEKKDKGKKENMCPISLTSLEHLNNYTKRLKKLKDERRSNELQNEAKFTAVDIAGARFIQLSAKQDDDTFVITNQFDCSISSLSDEESKAVELAQLLLASAESVHNKQFDLASRLLTQCDYLSTTTGNPVQRVVYYFAEGLRDRIDRETGRIPLKISEGRGEQPIDVDRAMMTLNPALLACHQTLPFGKVLQFAGIQAIVDNVASARKVHLIDFGVRIGMQGTVLMQALASRHQCPIELLKITAVGTLRQPIEETSKRLESFAESMNFPFEFEVLIISDLNELKPESFQIEADEAVAVYCPLFLRTMILMPDRLETLMRVVRNLNPCVMVVTEVEGNHNSPSFVNRFIETLFFYGAVFDCLGTCMDEQNHENRIVIERFYYGQAINNIVAFFTRYGMVETELSQSNLYQAHQILKQVPCWSSCSLDMNGECLILVWKGTPLSSVSAWNLESLSQDNTQTYGPISPLILSGLDDIAEPTKNGPCPNSLNKLKGVRGVTEITDAYTGGKLSPQETISLAGARYVALSTKKNDDHDMLSSTQSLTIEEIKNIELVEFLLASAESVSNKLFDIATKLVNQCVFFSSSTGNPVQRLVYYFAEALRERIDLVTGRINSIVFEDEVKHKPLDIEEAMMNPLPELLACHETLPFAKVLEFAGVQAIVENVASASTVHLIDFGIRIGMHAVVLMQALATRYECPIELLKVTAVQEADEAVAVNCSLLLRSMITNPDHLETLMTVIKNLNPCIVVVTEFEGKHNSNRTNILFFYGAFSHSLLYQANLILKQVDCWISCTLEMKGKSLIVGWKGTPIHSLSAWMFC
ncbi:hypothetical protein MKX03_014762 [Papaver bracteatum]|nr:hypothetical protein MKX03_014762 [Papaver bracteatum]